jgi:hypothetical protein
MRLISCSQCFKAVKAEQTTIVNGLRICHSCKAKKDKELYKNFKQALKK